MKYFYNYKNFVNESKKEKTGNLVGEFKKDVKVLLDDMFASVKKPTYTFDDEGYPKSVKFQIEKSDFNLNYDKIESEFSEGVLKKRTFVAILDFVSKDKEGDKGDEIYTITFSIKKGKVDVTKAKKETKKEDDEDDEPKVGSKDDDWYGDEDEKEEKKKKKK